MISQKHRLLSSGQGEIGPPGSKRGACMHMGFPGTWGSLPSPANATGQGMSEDGSSTDDQGPRPMTGWMHLSAERIKHPRQVPDVEGNRRHPGRIGDVGDAHMTREAGEATPGDPVEGRRVRNLRPMGEKDGGTIESHNRLNETATDSDTGQGRSGAGADYARPTPPTAHIRHI
jgi:hypothetical protein